MKDQTTLSSSPSTETYSDPTSQNRTLSYDTLNSESPHSDINISQPNISSNSPHFSYKLNSTSNNNHLSLTPIILKRHDSGIHLCKDNNEQNKHTFNKISITLAPLENISKEKTNSKHYYDLNIIDPVEHKISNNSDYFYISIKHKNEHITNKKKTLGLNYIPSKRNLMSPQENQFDKEITSCIQNGVDYITIEEKFSHLLKE